MKRFGIEMKNARIAAQEDVENTGADDVGQDRGNGDTGDAASKDEGKDQVEDNIDSTGHSQSHERRPRIAAAADNGRFEVVETHNGQANEINTQILLSRTDDVFRHTEKSQHRPRRDFPNKGQGYADDESHGQGCVQGFTGLIRTTCPQELGNDHVGPQGKAQKERHKEGNNGCIIAYGSHGFLTDELAQDGDVCRIKELLQDPRQSQGQGKKRQFIP